VIVIAVAEAIKRIDLVLRTVGESDRGGNDHVTLHCQRVQVAL